MLEPLRSRLEVILFFQPLKRGRTEKPHAFVRARHDGETKYRGDNDQADLSRTRKCNKHRAALNADHCATTMRQLIGWGVDSAATGDWRLGYRLILYYMLQMFMKLR